MTEPTITYQVRPYLCTIISYSTGGEVCTRELSGHVHMGICRHMVREWMK